jgi:hypothetical protein
MNKGFGWSHAMNLHGISTTIGKVGAIIRVLGFLYGSQFTHIVEVDKNYHIGIGI